MFNRQSPILVSLLPVLTAFFSLSASGHEGGGSKGKNYGACVEGGGSGCRGHHKGEHRRQHGRHPSHVRAAHSGYFHGGGAGGGGGGWSAKTASAGTRRTGRSGGSYATTSTGPSMGEVLGATALALAAANKRNQNQPSGSTIPRAQPIQVPTQNPNDDSNDDRDEEEIAQALGRAAFSTFAQVQAAVQSDLADCSGSTSQASRCCGDPSSCRGQLGGRDSRSYDAAMALINGGPQKSGLKDYCGQMKRLSDDAKNLNRGLSAVCFEAQDTCESVCQDLADDYADVLADCNGCEAQSLYQNALAQLRGGQRTCSSLGDNVDNMANQGIDSALNQAIALHCGDLSSSQNQARANSAQPGDAPLAKATESETAREPEPETTIADANHPERGPRMDMRVNAGQGFKGYSNDHAPDTQSPFEAKNNRNRGAGYGTASATPPTSSNGEKAAGANDKGKPGSGNSLDGQNTKADNDGRNKKNLARTGDKARGPAADGLTPISGNGAQFENFQSLSSYLPAGVRTAMNRISRSKEINDKEEDLFGRITAKIREKCRIGILKACEE